MGEYLKVLALLDDLINKYGIFDATLKEAKLPNTTTALGALKVFRKKLQRLIDLEMAEMGAYYESKK